MDMWINDEDRKKAKQGVYKEIGIWAACIVGAILLAFLITRFGLEKTTLNDSSMDETLKKGEKIIVNKVAYKFSKPKRFDVIVFEQKGKEHIYYNVKRIIGMPKEKVLIKDGRVYINDEKLEESVVVKDTINAGLADETIELADDEYFVLGDNRNNSEDSRYSNIGNVKKKDIVGKAWIRLKPFNFISKLNLVENQDK